MALARAGEGHGGPVEGSASAKALGQKGAWGVGRERRSGWPELGDGDRGGVEHQSPFWRQIGAHTPDGRTNFTLS